MTDKICLQWNDFRENVSSTFNNLRNGKEFADVTLGCEDGQQMEAHKVILAASSPFFAKILQQIKHPHPMIYLKGFQSKDFVSILDYLYFGEANVFQEDLASFLAIAEAIQLKGLTGQTSGDLIEEKPQPPQQIQTRKDLFNISTTPKPDIISKNGAPGAISTASVIPNTDLQALNEKVKSMMEKGQKMISDGKKPNGTPKQKKSYVCKECGKEGHGTLIRDHIEANHLEGVFIPCNFCSRTFQTRNAFSQHTNSYHK